MIYIVEPHYDDAFLGAGAYILSHPEEDFTIVSVSTSEANDKCETKKLADMLPNVSNIDLGWPDLHWKYRDTDDRNWDALKWIDYTVLYQEMYQERFGCLKEMKNSVLETIKGGEVWAPLGIQHPMHMIMRFLHSRPETKAIYLDQPYCTKKKFMELIVGICGAYQMGEAMWTTNGVVQRQALLEKKHKIFKEAYSSQAFYFADGCKTHNEYVFKCINPINLVARRV